MVCTNFFDSLEKSQGVSKQLAGIPCSYCFYRWVLTLSVTIADESQCFKMYVPFYLIRWRRARPPSGRFRCGDTATLWSPNYNQWVLIIRRTCAIIQLCHLRISFIIYGLIIRLTICRCFLSAGPVCHFTVVLSPNPAYNLLHCRAISQSGL